MNNKELQDIKDELLKVIEDMPEIQRYLEVKELVGVHPGIRALTREIKKTQKRLVNTQQAQKPEQAKVFEALLEEKNAALEEIVLYQEFITASMDAQIILDEMSVLINDYLVEK